MKIHIGMFAKVVDNSSSKERNFMMLNLRIG